MKGLGKSASLARFLTVWVALVCTAVFLHARGSFESVPHRQPLETFPRELQGWTGTDTPLAPDVLELLGPGDFLTRTYTNPSVPEFVNLYVAYYPSQRTADTTHSPQNCMPGAGWTALQSEPIQIQPTGGTRHVNVVIANRIVFGKGLDQVLVLYWFQARGRTTPSEYWGKFYLVRDSIAMHRTDGGMVRLLTPISNPSDVAQAQARAVGFAQVVLSKLDDYIPR